jgi:hypothetical protein
MHNVNAEAVDQTAKRAAAQPDAVLQAVAFGGEWLDVKREARRSPWPSSRS